MEVQAVSLLPLAAAILSGTLVVIALESPRRSRTIAFFALLNASIVAWSFSYFIQLNLTTHLEPSISPIGSPEYLLFVVLTLGLAGAPTYWFLFAAAYSGKKRWTSGLGLVAAHLPLAYTLVVAMTNPMHRLFVSGLSETSQFTYGPLAPAHQIGTFALIIGGILLFIPALWREPWPGAKKRALMVAAAVTVQMVGGVSWSLRESLSLPITINPTPVLFSLLSALLAYLVLRGGLAEIVPQGALQAFRTISDAILVVDDRDVIVTLNPAAEALFDGAHPGRELSDVGVLADQVDHYVAGGGLAFAECETVIDGRIYWMRMRHTRLGGRAPIGRILVFTDMTELKIAQEDLSELNSQLQLHVEALERAHAESDKRAVALERANRDLRIATQAKSRFLANMSHELRTPLNSIIGFTGVLIRGMAGPVNSEQERQLKMVSDSGQNLLTLIDDILDLSKIESGTERIDFAPADLEAIVLSAAEKARPLIEKKGLQLHLSIPCALPEVLTDGARVQQILLNLLSNAGKFTELGSVTLEVLRRGDTVRFHVADTGVGIPADCLEHVFEPFERVERDSGPRVAGTGLGLAISRDLAIALGGDLTVSSVEGQGSRFTLTLPAGALPSTAGDTAPDSVEKKDRSE